MVATTPALLCTELDCQTCAVGQCTVLLQTAVICYGPVVATETMQVAFDPYQTFQMLSIRN